MRGAGRPGGSTAVLMALALAAPLAGIGVFHVWSRTRVQAAGYELGRLESEHRQLLAERDRLNLEVATLRSPGRLERFARERLGMAPPAPGAVMAGMAGGGKGLLGGVGDGADPRPGPAEPAGKTTKPRREARSGPLTRAPEPARP
jgi:cell division protein FtsL